MRTAAPTPAPVRRAASEQSADGASLEVLPSVRPVFCMTLQPLSSSSADPAHHHLVLAPCRHAAGK